MLEKDFATRWHYKLILLEKYTILCPYLEIALPDDAPKLFDLSPGDALQSALQRQRCCSWCAGTLLRS